MKVNVGKEIAAMEQMAVGQLRDRYAEVFGETTDACNKQWLLSLCHFSMRTKVYSLPYLLRIWVLKSKT